jgi:hypothetical protein
VADGVTVETCSFNSSVTAGRNAENVIVLRHQADALARATTPQAKHIPNAVRHYGDGQSEWFKIGVACTTVRVGFNVFLHALPVYGHIVFVLAEKWLSGDAAAGPVFS